MNITHRILLLIATASLIAFPGCSLLQKDNVKYCSQCKRDCAREPEIKPVAEPEYICDECMASSGGHVSDNLPQDALGELLLPPTGDNWNETKTDDRMDMLMMQVAQMEEQRQADDRSLKTLTQSIESMNQELGTLSGEVKYWKNEVQRVESETIAQQKADLETIKTLNELVEQIPIAASSRRR